jgi:hypothetical protein
VRQVAESASLPRVLVFAHPSLETDELLRDLERRPDLCLLRVSTVSAIRVALQDVPVALVLVGPTTDTETFSAVLKSAKELRPRTPVLALGSEAHLPQARTSPTLARLRGPVLPEVLNRTVDVALGLRASEED